MTLYRYRAVDEEGRPVEGTMEEGSARRVTSALQERGLSVNTVEELHKPKGLLRVSSRLTWTELNLFAEQLGAIARSELPLAPSLRALAADLKNPRLKPVLDRLCSDLEHGVALDDAIAAQHQSFPAIFPSLLRAGERTGNLPGVLQALTGYTGRMVNLRNMLQTALAYPAMVIVVTLGILTFMLLKVVPVFADIFKEFGGQLPWPTQFWMNVSTFVVFRWHLVLGAGFAGIALVVFLGKLLKRSESGRCWLDSIHLHVPVLGRLRYLLATARFSRTLGLLLASRVPVLDSLELAAATAESPLLQRAAEEACMRVAAGERIADALRSTGFFGYQFCWLLGVGEGRGQAEEALENIAAGLDRELASRDRMLGVLISPILLVLLGTLLGSVIVSLYLPIYSLGHII
jgi:type IV pilus assembly protein PilC